VLKVTILIQPATLD